MSLLLASVLVGVWGVGSLAFHAADAVINLAPAFAFVSAAVHFGVGRRPGARV